MNHTQAKAIVDAANTWAVATTALERALNAVFPGSGLIELRPSDFPDAVMLIIGAKHHLAGHDEGYTLALKENGVTP